MPKQPINRQRVQRRVQYAAGRLQQRALGATESLTLADVVFSNNSAALAGGGINHFSSAVAAQTPKTEAMLALVHATVSGNSVTANSGHAAGLSVAGLGLSLARQIAHEHKGALECLPRDGGGGHFRLTLPCLPSVIAKV